MYRFLLTRRWLALLVVVVVAAVGCVLLGRWQLSRMMDRNAANDLVERNADARPVSAAQLVTPRRGPAAAHEWRQGRATGRYDRDRTLLVRNQPRNGEVGYDVLVPLVTAEGPALLVDRGWVPGGATATDRPDVPAPPRGTVTVVGRIRPSEPASTTGTPPPGQVTRVDVSAIRASLPYPVYGGFADLVRERPAPGTAPEPPDDPSTGPGPHLAYGMQWFLFAGLALGGYVILARREAADRRATTRTEPQPTVTLQVPG